MILPGSERLNDEPDLQNRVTRVEEGLTEIRERIIPDSKSQKEAVGIDPRVWINRL